MTTTTVVSMRIETRDDQHLAELLADNGVKLCAIVMRHYNEDSVLATGAWVEDDGETGTQHRAECTNPSGCDWPEAHDGFPG
jgi:hypothetical protein